MLGNEKTDQVESSKYLGKIVNKRDRYSEDIKGRID